MSHKQTNNFLSTCPSSTSVLQHVTGIVCVDSRQSATVQYILSKFSTNLHTLTFESHPFQLLPRHTSFQTQIQCPLKHHIPSVQAAKSAASECPSVPWYWTIVKLLETRTNFRKQIFKKQGARHREPRSKDPRIQGSKGPRGQGSKGPPKSGKGPRVQGGPKSGKGPRRIQGKI